MLTVTAAGAMAGYSTEDHLIDDETDQIVGKTYRSLPEALRAADACVSLRGRPHPYAWINYRDERGEVRRAFSYRPDQGVVRR